VKKVGNTNMSILTIKADFVNTNFALETAVKPKILILCY